SQAVVDVIAGHIPTMFIPLPEALPQAQSDKVRIIAITDDKRSPQVPNVATIAEQGFPGYRGVSWNGLMTPTATPKGILNRSAAESSRAAKEPGLVGQLTQQGVTATGLTPDEFAQFLKEDIGVWAEAVKIAGVTSVP